MKQIHTILVVEDERPILEIIQDKLRSHGYQVATAQRTASALNFLEDGLQPDLIWLDHYLPDQTGLDLAAHLKEQERWKDIPIFLVSNTATQDKVAAYLSLGVEKYFTKSSIKMDDIIADIGVLLHQQEDRI